MNPTNPLSIIKSDHDKVKSMFEDYEQGEDFDDKKDQARDICEKLAVHMGMEEEHFYPEVRGISDEGEDLVEDALGEHEDIKVRISETDQAESEAELDESVDMLEEAFLNHIDEEETEIFPLAEDNLKDRFTSMAAKMISYKASSKGEMLLDKIKSMF